MNKKGESTLRKYSQMMRVKRYSDRTIDIYTYYARIYLNSFDCDFYHISINETVIFLQEYNYTSRAQQNQFISSIKLIFEYLRKVSLKGIEFERPRKSKTLPKVIDKYYLLDCLSKIKNIKHLAILSLAYSVGLRVSEVVNLKIEDIDSNRMIIHIRNAKGNKDRLVPLSHAMLILLRKYFNEYKPYRYLFNGQKALKYTSGSCNKIVKHYLGNNYHFHMLRHSSFTSMLESGTDISIIQKIAGHSKVDTTRIYTQVSTQLLQKAKLPI